MMSVGKPHISIPRKQVVIQIEAETGKVAGDRTNTSSPVPIISPRESGSESGQRSVTATPITPRTDFSTRSSPWSIGASTPYSMVSNGSSNEAVLQQIQSVRNHLTAANTFSRGVTPPYDRIPSIAIECCDSLLFEEEGISKDALETIKACFEPSKPVRWPRSGGFRYEPLLIESEVMMAERALSSAMMMLSEASSDWESDR